MNNESKKKESILRNNAVQTIIASLLCIVIGLLIGYLVLLIINPAGAAGAITAIIKNYFYYPSQKAMMKYMGTTLVKASALLMCSLSVLFAYKVGLFNIGAAGQYVVGAGASLYFALKLGMPWYVCMIAAIVIAALVGGISGALKAYFNVNEVISCIMLNWISLYVVNMILTQVKSESTPYTVDLSSGNKSALLPNCGLDEIFSGNKFVSIGLIISVVMAIVVWVLLEKTKFGFELRATGMNKKCCKILRHEREEKYHCNHDDRRRSCRGLVQLFSISAELRPGWFSRQPFRAWALMESQQHSLVAFTPSEQFSPLILSSTSQVVEVMWIRLCIVHRSRI